MDAKEIIAAVTALSMSQQKYVAKWLIWNIDRIEHLQSASERWKAVVAAAEDVTNMVNNPARKDGDSCFVRTLAVWRMVDEGYTRTQIARAMGKDHSTVTHICTIRKDAVKLPNAYRAYLHSFDKLKLALNDDR